MRRALVAILVALMCMAGPVGGQSTFGSIVGVVHDASEGLIAALRSRYEVWKTTVFVPRRRARMDHLNL